MTQKEIKKVLESESGMILLEKKSSYSFQEYILSSSASILSVLYFVRRKKMDRLILTDKRLIYLIKNKVYLELEINGVRSLKYDEYKSGLEIVAEKKYSIPLDKMEINRDERNLLNRKLTEFLERASSRK